MSAEVVAVAYIYYIIGLILCCLDFIRNQYIEFIKRKESLRAIFEMIHHKCSMKNWTEIGKYVSM